MSNKNTPTAAPREMKMSRKPRVHYHGAGQLSSVGVCGETAPKCEMHIDLVTCRVCRRLFSSIERDTKLAIAKFRAYEKAHK